MVAGPLRQPPSLLQGIISLLRCLLSPFYGNSRQLFKDNFRAGVEFNWLSKDPEKECGKIFYRHVFVKSSNELGRANKLLAIFSSCERTNERFFSRQVRCVLGNDSNPSHRFHRSRKTAATRHETVRCRS